MHDDLKAHVEAQEGGIDRVTAMAYLERDNGAVPCSRYGSDGVSCAPAAYALAAIVAGETGEPMTFDGLDHAMSLVVNDYDDPETLIRDRGAEYGFSADEILS